MVYTKSRSQKSVSKSRTLKGGSLASDKVMKVANGVGMTVDDYNKMPLPKMGSLKKQTGGSSCAKKHTGAGCGGTHDKRIKSCKRRNSKKKTSATKKVQRTKQNGGRFLNLAGCGPVNAPDAGRKYAKHFSKTSSCPGPEFYANPPGLDKAGSGNGNAYPFN